MHKQTVVDFKDLGQRLVFKNPLRELIAERLEEVIPVLRKVESYQKQGYYVVGYLSYEASKAFEPKCQVHQRQLSGEHFAYFTVHETAVQDIFPLTYNDVVMPKHWDNLTNKKVYEEAISEIHHQIRHGNTYQVNYTVQLKSEVETDSFAIYNRLVVEQGAAYNIYVAHDDFAVVSASPELFFEKKQRVLRTRPMKGTTKRGKNSSEDLAQRNWLEQDVKNRAENMMIVDLLRNDMGRISEIGSVTVTKLCQLERYSTVWQMTSTIESHLKTDTDLVDVFTALFPCGSITGAPKLSTMDTIYRLENEPRGVYCGTVGICLPNGDCIFNVAIRTLQIYRSQAIYGVGGGITWDSQWQDEYEETCQKSAILYRQQKQFDLITTGKICEGKLMFLEEHLQRLLESSDYFDYSFDKDKARRNIEEALKGLDKQQNYRMRIRLEKSGRLHLDTEELADLPKTFLKAKLVERKVLLDQPFTFFKTSYRPHISTQGSEQIFISPEGYLQETSIANLILEIDGEWLTPPAKVGLLEGIYRNYLIKSGKVKEVLLTREDLKKAQQVYACNAVRGLYPLEIVD
ncbi:MAG: aminodeoxychorismate synthase component I [Streptococcus orisratti]|uniref:aminodeoxychorismate synthase component I n=1 Tax=Streptococcus orisratti TaxID=114652 RepID=UPI0023573EF1|nr:aminodeoxychorismate synthase component I [Streptococcus orisratti]MCI7677047.1 aminodeoxychorismate synthase component I [Streptococcus orisratti]MDY5635215.1 aminodeoxychorismate synthase component I [Streptococcus orisratti]